MCNENCRSCGFIEFTIGIVLGIITFLLLGSGIFTVPVALIIAVLAAAIFGLIFLAVISVINATNIERRLGKCLKRNVLCIIIGIVGSFIFAVAALAVSAEIIVLFYVVTAIAVAFGVATLLGIARLIICLADYDD